MRRTPRMRWRVRCTPPMPLLLRPLQELVRCTSPLRRSCVNSKRWSNVAHRRRRGDELCHGGWRSADCRSYTTNAGAAIPTGAGAAYVWNGAQEGRKTTASIMTRTHQEIRRVDGRRRGGGEQKKNGCQFFKPRVFVRFETRSAQTFLSRTSFFCKTRTAWVGMSHVVEIW